MSLDIQGKITKIHLCTTERQKLENAPNQGQHIGLLGSQVESCGAESDAPLLELIFLSCVLYCIASLRLCMSTLDCSLCRKKKPFTITKGCKNAPFAHTEINPTQSPVTTGNKRACSKKRYRNNHGGTFSLLYLPSIQHNSLRKNLISKYITDEWDVSSYHTDVL